MLDQSTNTNRVMYLMWPDEGLGSLLLTRMIPLIRYCLFNNIYFILDDIISLGCWSDYFECLGDYNVDEKMMKNALHLEVITRDPRHSDSNVKSSVLAKLNYLIGIGLNRDGGQKTTIRFCTHGRHKRKEMRYPVYDLQECHFSEETVFNKVFRLNSQIKKMISQLRNSISLPRDYACFHIRRGDAQSLLGLDVIRIDQYLDKHQSMSAEVLRDVFICTDDYSVIETLKGSGLNIYFLTDESQRGHFQWEFNKDADKHDKVVQMLAEIEIASRSCAFVGSKYSGFSELIKMMHKLPDRCILI